MSIKKLLFILLLFVALPSQISAQVSKFRATAYCSKFPGDRTYSDWEESNVLITIDIADERIKIYSKLNQIYDIVNYDEVYEDSDGDSVLMLYCVDADGTECRIRLIVRHDTGSSELYCDYSDVSWVYQVRKLDN